MHPPLRRLNSLFATKKPTSPWCSRPVLPTIAPYLLPRFLPEFSRKYPQVDLHISEMKTADVKRALEKGDIDAAIVAQLADLEELLYAYRHGIISEQE